MLAVKGVYENGEIKLAEKPNVSKDVPVIVTFLDDTETDKKAIKKESKRLNLDNFSFKRSRKILKDYQGSLSDAVIEERRRFV